MTNILASNNLHRLSDDIDTYLYGHVSIRQSENKTILSATINFDKETKIFS